MSDETVRPAANVRAAMEATMAPPPDSAVKPARPAERPAFGEARRRRWHRFGNAVGVFACLFTVFIGTVFGLFFWGSKAFQELLRGHGVSVLWNTVVHRDPLADWTPDKQFPGRSSINVLVLGIDYDYDNKAQIIKNSWGRSDSILLARVDFENKTVSALTIPRDSAVRIPGYRGIHKINAAHSWKGPTLTKETIKSVFGVEADAVVSLDFKGFQKIVDAIGGVEVTIDKPLHYDDNWGNLHVHLEPGRQRLNGYQAMGYVRIRKVDSDLMRSKRQHDFLEAVRNQIKSPGTFGALPKAMDALSESINTQNITRDQMYALMNFARTLDRKNIQVETLPSIEGRSYVTIDAEKGKDVIQRMFFPGQDVAVEIDAPNMASRSRTTARRPSRRVRSNEYVKPAGGLSVETPPATSESPEPPASEPGGSGTTPDGPSTQTDPMEPRATG